MPGDVDDGGRGGVTASAYFVTGSTGAVGSALVPALLLDPQARVHLLVRADGAADLQRRLDTLFAFWSLGPAEREARARVVAYAGDVTAPRLALAEADFSRLASTCTHIVHCAGAVRMNLPLDAALQSSVGAARNVVALARECQANATLRKVEFVSTVGVLGCRNGVLDETWVNGARAFHNTYEAAKAEAEDYVASEIARGLPATVHRPSMVVGHSQTGRIAHFQVFYHLCDFLSGRRTHGVYPDLGAMRLDTIPADFVGTAIAWYSGQPSTVGKIVHLCAGPEESLPLVELKAIVGSALRERSIRLPRPLRVSPRVFRRLARALEWVVDANTRRALRTLPVFLDYLAADSGFANGKTTATLAAAGIVRPKPRDYLPTVIGHYLDRTTAAPRSDA